MLKTIRENLKYYREQKELSQETLSRKCNYDKTYVGKIERGDTNPSVEAILRIAEVLDIPTIKFFKANIGSSPDDFQQQLENPTDQIIDLFIDVFENSPSISLLTNKDGEIIQVNRAAGKFFKADVNNVVGQDIEALSFWSQSGLDPSIFKDLCELADIGKQATRRVTLRYKGEEVDLQIQVSFADSVDSRKTFVIYQLFLVEETSDRTLIGDHFELLRD